MYITVRDVSDTVKNTGLFMVMLCVRVAKNIHTKVTMNPPHHVKNPPYHVQVAKNHRVLVMAQMPMLCLSGADPQCIKVARST